MISRQAHNIRHKAKRVWDRLSEPTRQALIEKLSEEQLAILIGPLKIRDPAPMQKLSKIKYTDDIYAALSKLSHIEELANQYDAFRR